MDVEGNYDFDNNSAYRTDQMNNLSGDFAVTYIMDNPGNLRAKAFSRQITTFDENQGLQESGIGIYYKEDFNKFKDLIAKYKENTQDRKIRNLYKAQQIDSLGRDGYKAKMRIQRLKERQENRK